MNKWCTGSREAERVATAQKYKTERKKKQDERRRKTKTNHCRLAQEWPWPPPAVGTCELLFEWLLTLLLPAPPAAAATPPALLLLLLLTLTLGTCELASATTAAAAAAIGDTGDTLDELDEACNGGGASLRGGIRSFMASKPLASSNDLIWWVGENPCKAARERKTFRKNVEFKFKILIDEFLPFLSVALPPERAPSGKDPVGVNPLSWRTLSLSSLKEKLKIAIDKNEMKRRMNGDTSKRRRHGPFCRWLEFCCESLLYGWQLLPLTENMISFLCELITRFESNATLVQNWRKIKRVLRVKGKENRTINTTLLLGRMWRPSLN